MADEEYPQLVEYVREKAKGCCGDDSWRGYFCDFHRGYLDGLEDGLEWDT